MPKQRIAIIGTVGLPANYGGFETLVENLVSYHHTHGLSCDITVYCSSKSYVEKKPSFLSARLKYIPFSANGAQSIVYDWVSLLSAMWRSDVILLLGVSGSTMLPLVRLFSPAKVITNIDGIEWRREKWKGLAKWFLKLSEKIAILFSHEVIADNDAIAEYVKKEYGTDCHVIAYGGDHALAVAGVPVDELGLPDQYAFSVCRIEPENNIHMILEGFSRGQLPLVMVGNWNGSSYGRELRNSYADGEMFYLLDPIYDLGRLKTLRSNALMYVHGHSAGGTNPSLVEAMHFGRPIIAFDCPFNRCTTEGKALFFRNAFGLSKLISEVLEVGGDEVGAALAEVARRRYVWSEIAKQYFLRLNASEKTS